MYTHIYAYKSFIFVYWRCCWSNFFGHHLHASWRLRTMNSYLYVHLHVYIHIYIYRHEASSEHSFGEYMLRKCLFIFTLKCIHTYICMSFLCIDWRFCRYALFGHHSYASWRPRTMDTYLYLHVHIYIHIYMHRLEVSPEYPFWPPLIRIMTPNGRFTPDHWLCKTLSDYHPEGWQPSWSLGVCVCVCACVRVRVCVCV